MAELIEGLRYATRNALLNALFPDDSQVRNEADGSLSPKKVRSLFEDGFFDHTLFGLGPKRLNELRVWCGLPPQPERRSGSANNRPT